MKLNSLTISGFRCFNADSQTISLNDISCLVGPNASGKTAAMMALVRLFGEHPFQRQLTTEDFHLIAGEKLRDKTERTLSIECRIDFPELSALGTPAGNAVPESFNQMIVDAPGKPPFCRLRLEGTWTDNGTPAGDVEQSLDWILTESDDSKIINDGNVRKVQAGDRRRIRVIYVPAARDPDKQIALTTSTAFGRLLNGLSLNGAEDELQQGLDALQSQIGALTGVKTLNTHVQKSWSDLYKGQIAQQVAFRALEGDPLELLSRLAAHFAPGEDGRTMLSANLSDGLRSLFSLSLSLALFDVEQAMTANPNIAGFKEELVKELPLLTVFAVEEPENHLSPHYLGRVVTQLTTLAAHPHAQVLVSSHSPAILGRVRPDDVRYFLGNENVAFTRVKALPLPVDETDESFKYVREAVRGFPELYFSRLIIFGEGPSEEIILKRLFEANGAPLDSNFISIVPLGGRHVNHFWRLVHGLEIPHLTLLDLDREKEGAGWSRIQYVRDELVKHMGKNHPDLQFDSGNKRCSLADDTYNSFSTYDVSDAKLLEGWISYFQTTFGVFFSAPLDIDFAMLEAFPSTYKEQAEQGPRLPNPVKAKEYQEAVLDRIKQVLAANPSKAPDSTGSTYSLAQRELFPWYKYLFLDGSKPVAHMRAMISLKDIELLKSIPLFLRELVDTATTLVSPDSGDE
jgi:putative ATP-dependent endonuclease of OLD family